MLEPSRRPCLLTPCRVGQGARRPAFAGVRAVPCTGALLVLLFGLANDLLWPSVTMVIAISLGMALALSAVGIAAILGRRFVDRCMEGDAARHRRFAHGARIAGAACVLMIGIALFAIAWIGKPLGIQPTETAALGDNL